MPKAQTKKSSKTHIIWVMLVGILLAYTLVIALQSKYQNQEKVASLPSVRSNELKELNGRPSYNVGNPEAATQYSFHLRYPANYYASTPDMMESYVSQGGGGFPSVILTKDYQPNGASIENPDWVSGIYASGKSCIFITAGTATTQPLLDGAPNGINGLTVEKSEQLKINKWQTLLRSTTFKRVAGGPTVPGYQAVIIFPDKTLFTFETCDRSNKEDLLTVLKYFDIRGLDR